MHWMLSLLSVVGKKRRCFPMVLGVIFFCYLANGTTQNSLPLNARTQSLDCRFLLSAHSEEAKDRREVVAFNTFRMNFADIPIPISKQIEKAIQFSRSNTLFKESGFYVLVMTNGDFFIGDLYTSGRETSLSSEDGKESFNKLLARVDKKDIARIEHYHTHPPEGPLSQSLSPSDISACLHNQKLFAMEDINVPYVENAIHTSNDFGTKPGNIARVEMTPEEVRRAREKIAADLRQRRHRRSQQIRIPEKVRIAATVNQDGQATISGNEARRVAIKNAIVWAYDVETQGRGYQQVIRARQARLESLGFLVPVSSADRNPIFAFSDAWAIAAALGIRGEVPNSIKKISDSYLTLLLENSMELKSPEPNALVVYSDGENILGLAAFRYTTSEGVWRVDRRLNITGEVSYEQDWDDVPPEFGSTITFYRLPELPKVRQLFNLED